MRKPYPTNEAAGGAGTGEGGVWGPGVYGVSVSALDEVIEFMESGEVTREAPAGFTGLRGSC